MVSIPIKTRAVAGRETRIIWPIRQRLRFVIDGFTLISGKRQQQQQQQQPKKKYAGLNQIIVDKLPSNKETTLPQRCTCSARRFNSCPGISGPQLRFAHGFAAEQ